MARGSLSELICLDSKEVSWEDLRLSFFPNGDRRTPEVYIQKFIGCCREPFEYLGIEACLVGSGKDSSLSLTTSRYIGAVPLYTSQGLQACEDLTVLPRFNSRDKLEEYIQLIQLIREDISVELWDYRIHLRGPHGFILPRYIPAMKFITSLESLLQHPWTKFACHRTYLPTPSGVVDWSEYACRSYNPEYRLSFPTDVNAISPVHDEYAALHYVFQLCKKELLSHRTPLRVQASSLTQLEKLQTKLYSCPIKQVKWIETHRGDPPLAKACKVLANLYLQHEAMWNLPWRMDVAELFERYVQYLFEQAIAPLGGCTTRNPKARAKGTKYPWELHYLEPDLILQCRAYIIVVDAKYKSHLLNQSEGVRLREDYRADLHQLLAYLSFAGSKDKLGVLCYPSTEVHYHETNYTFDRGGTNNKVILVGIPFQRKKTQENINELSKLLDRLTPEGSAELMGPR